MNYPREHLEELLVTLKNNGDFFRAFSGATSDSARRNFIERAWQEARRDASSCPRPNIAQREQLRYYFEDHWNLPTTQFSHAPNSRFWEESAKPASLDYTTLPDGTVLISAEGTRWVKGKPTQHGGGKAKPDRPVFGSREDGLTWCSWAADGSAAYDLHIVAYELPSLNPPSLQPPIGEAEKETSIMDMTKELKITTQTLVNGVDVTTLNDSAIYELIAAQEAKIAALEAIKSKPKKLVAEIKNRQAGIDALVAHLDSKGE